MYQILFLFLFIFSYETAVVPGWNAKVYTWSDGDSWDAFHLESNKIDEFVSSSIEISANTDLGVNTPSTYYSAHFSGYLEIPFDGKYRFSFLADDHASLSVNGAVEISRLWFAPQSQLDTDYVDYVAGDRVDLSVLYGEKVGGVKLDVYWSAKDLTGSADWTDSVLSDSDIKNNICIGDGVECTCTSYNGEPLTSALITAIRDEGCTKINGDLLMDDTIDASNLHGLESVRVITGIWNCSSANVDITGLGEHIDTAGKIWFTGCTSPNAIFTKLENVNQVHVGGQTSTTLSFPNLVTVSQSSFGLAGNTVDNYLTPKLTTVGNGVGLHGSFSSFEFMSSLQSIGNGVLDIQGSSATSLAGFENLQTARSLSINYMPNLVDISALNNLTTLSDKWIQLHTLNSLTQSALEAFHPTGITFVNFRVLQLPLITSFASFSDMMEPAMDYIWIFGSAIQDLSGFEGVTSTDTLILSNIPTLKNIDALSNLESVTTGIAIKSNVALLNIYGLASSLTNTVNKRDVTGFTGNYEVDGNTALSCSDQCNQEAMWGLIENANVIADQCNIVAEPVRGCDPSSSCQDGDLCLQCVDPSTCIGCVEGFTCMYGNCVNNWCACASGFTGANCDISGGANQGCAFGELENMVTDHIPVYLPDESGFTSGNLKIVIASPLVTNRLNTVVKIGSGNGTGEGCMYPPYGHWTKFITDCQDTYTLNINWVTVLGCGWEKDDTSDAEWTQYISYITVTHYDLLDVFRGKEITRDTEHIIPIRVRFQTVVEVSTEITVYSPVNLLTAITRQTYDPETSTGILEIRTSLQNPFILTSEVLSSAPATIIPVLTLESESCPDDGSTPCDQIWRITIDPNSACTLTGDYVLDFTIDCVNPADCPIDLNDNAVQLTAEINSEDFCTEIVLDIGLTGVMAVYRDAIHQFAKDDFLYDQIAHFKVELSSEAVIIDNQILSVWIEQNGAGTVFFDGAGLSEAGTNANYLAYDGGDDWAAFSFTPNEVTTPVPEDSSEAFDVFCRIEVTYQEDEIVKRKRYLMQAEGSQTSTTSAHFALENNNAVAQENQNNNDGNVSSSSSLVVGVVSFVALVILF